MRTANILIAGTEVHVIMEALSVSSDMRQQITRQAPSKTVQAQSSLFSQKNEIRYLSKRITGTTTFLQFLRSSQAALSSRPGYVKVQALYGGGERPELHGRMGTQGPVE